VKRREEKIADAERVKSFTLDQSATATDTILSGGEDFGPLPHTSHFSISMKTETETLSSRGISAAEGCTRGVVLVAHQDVNHSFN
jgi:hypothetical protein